VIHLHRACRREPINLLLMLDDNIHSAKENAMNPVSRKTMTSKFSPSTQQRLNSYALAASAAGVGALALAAPAQARIVYTPTHHLIKQGGTYKLDVNHDGITDFTLNDTYTATSSGFYAILSAAPAAGNGLEGWTGGEPWAFALKPGAAIGSRHYFPGKVLVLAASLAGSLTYEGSWVNVKNRYAGLQFKIAGKIHYGWARFSVQVVNRSSVTATLTGYAYETTPGKPIHAGQTTSGDKTGVEPPTPASHRMPAPKSPTLGRLAMGAPGLSIWRRNYLPNTPKAPSV
jgi:hypothetical protein